jgi:hypothetical protein
MTSPYLGCVRHARELIEQLIAARQLELSRAYSIAERQRIERVLSFLREELTRLSDRE